MVGFIFYNPRSVLKAALLFLCPLLSNFAFSANCDYFECIVQGELEAVKKYIVNGTDIEESNYKGATGLHISAAMNKPSIAKYFLNKGAKKEAITDDLWTPLHFACVSGSSEVFDLLIDSGVNIYAVTNNGDSALHLAASGGQVRELVRLLLMGLDVNIRNNDGYTPLHWASHEGRRVVLDMLIKWGGNTALLTNKGESILDLARENNKMEIVKYLELEQK